MLVPDLLARRRSVSSHSANVRPPSLSRRLGKLAWFLTRGHSLAQARWLARHDAPKVADARGISLEALAAAHRADPSWADIAIADGRVSSRTLNTAFNADDPAARGYQVWLELTRRGWRFEPRPAGGLIARLGDLALNLTTDEETEMIREIHVDGCYDLRLAGRTHVIDVGGNVGMAALYLARLPGVARVTSFEPFAPTAEGFAANLALNPTLAPRITLVPAALGDSDATREVDYVPELRGSMSIDGLGAWRGHTAANIRKLSIKIRRASSAIAPLLAAARADHATAIAKIDCEGSEFAIFRDLEAAGLINVFTAFMLEWHDQRPDPIVDTLLRHNFAVHVRALAADGTFGLIHAVRTAPPR